MATIKPKLKNKNDPTNLTVLRKEFKYHISNAAYYKLVSALSNILQPDSYNIPGGYKVRSCYFDNMENSDYYEKDYGIFQRKKIRLRIYTPDSDQAKLELKQKYGNNQKKETTFIPREACYKLLAGDYSVISNTGNSLLDRLYCTMSTEAYRPVVTTEYDREAYLYPLGNVRITFDHNVRANSTDLDLFNPHMLFTPVFNETVLEVKYSGYLPSFIQDILSRQILIHDSISKYTNSRDIY